MPRIVHTLCKTPCSQQGPPVLRSSAGAGQGLLPRQQSALHAGQGRVGLLQEALPGRAGCAAGMGPQVLHSRLVVGRVRDAVQRRISVAGDHRIQPIGCRTVYS